MRKKRKDALHEPCSSGRESAHSSLEKLEPTDVGCYEPVQVHGPNACAKNERTLSMNLVAADASPLILHWRSLSRLTSAATSQSRFMAPMHAQKNERDRKSTRLNSSH